MSFKAFPHRRWTRKICLNKFNSGSHPTRGVLAPTFLRRKVGSSTPFTPKAFALSGLRFASLRAPELESRQSCGREGEQSPNSLRAPELESRQSTTFTLPRTTRVCAPRYWNQGKAGSAAYRPERIVCAPRNWNQGKAVAAEPSAARQSLRAPELESRQSASRRATFW